MLDSIPIRVNPRYIRAIAAAALNPFKFKQRYAEAVLRQTVRSAGHRITSRKANNDGSIMLTVRTQ